MDTALSVDKIQRLIVDYEGGARTSIFVPNVSWGYFKSHEADLLRISKQGYLTEYEIKRSWSDFLADFKKDGTHFEGKVELITIEDNGAEKRRAVTVLIQDNLIEDALHALKKNLASVDCEILAIKKSQILDIIREVKE